VKHVHYNRINVHQTRIVLVDAAFVSGGRSASRAAFGASPRALDLSSASSMASASAGPQGRTWTPPRKAEMASRLYREHLQIRGRYPRDVQTACDAAISSWQPPRLPVLPPTEVGRQPRCLLVERMQYIRLHPRWASSDQPEFLGGLHVTDARSAARGHMA